MTPPNVFPSLTPLDSGRNSPRCPLAMFTLADSLTDLLIDWMSDLTICAKCSRARGKPRWAIALWHKASSSSQKARWNSQLVRQVLAFRVLCRTWSAQHKKKGPRRPEVAASPTQSGREDLNFRPFGPEPNAL